MIKKITITLLLLIPLIIINGSFAQTPEVTNGLNYLTTTQNPDGSWGNETSSTEPLPATASAIETLQILNKTSSQNYTDAVSWLQSQTLDTTDYLSERIHALSVAGADLDVLTSYFDAIYTGAWGAHGNFESNNLDTALALLALNKINYSDLETISYALAYFISNQNTDGGFGLHPDGDSNVYMTALVVKALASYNGIFDLQTEIDDATAYLLTKQNVDGGFPSTPSTGSGSEVYSTALAFEALQDSDADLSTIAQPVTDYLIANQLANGSWNDDPYSTALALRALAGIKPNLSISSNDITFSDPAPTGNHVPPTRWNMVPKKRKIIVHRYKNNNREYCKI